MKTFVIIIGIALVVGLAALGLFMNKLGGTVGDPIMLIQELFLAGAVMALFFVVPMILNTMYMSNDLPVLLTLPYSYNEIIMAKVMNVSSLVWLASAVFSLPCGLAYGVVNGKGASFFLALLLAAVCVPVISLSFSGSVIILVMSFVHTLRNKDTLRVLGAIFGFLILIGIVFATHFNKTDSGAVSKIIGGIGKFVNVLPINFALKVLLQGEMNGLMVLAIVGITVGFFLIFAVLVKFLYIKGALSMQDTSSASVRLEGAAFEKACAQKSVFKTYLAKEFKLVKKNPAFLMNGFLVPYIYPLVIIVLYIFSGNALEVLSIKNLNTTMDALGWTTGMAMLIASMAASGNVIATTCMSREGADIAVLKSLPVDYRDVLRAKQWTALLVSGGSCVLYDVVGGGIMVAVGKLPIWVIPYALAVSFSIMFFCTGMVIIPDIKKPLFTWESEADMIKNRTTATSIITLLAAVFISMGVVMFVRVLPESLFWPILAGALVVCALLVLLTDKRLIKVGLEKMAKY